MIYELMSCASVFLLFEGFDSGVYIRKLNWNIIEVNGYTNDTGKLNFASWTHVLMAKFYDFPKSIEEASGLELKSSFWDYLYMHRTWIQIQLQQWCSYRGLWFSIKWLNSISITFTINNILLSE